MKLYIIYILKIITVELIYGDTNWSDYRLSHRMRMVGGVVLGNRTEKTKEDGGRDARSRRGLEAEETA